MSTNEQSIKNDAANEIVAHAGAWRAVLVKRTIENLKKSKSPEDANHVISTLLCELELDDVADEWHGGCYKDQDEPRAVAQLNALLSRTDVPPAQKKRDAHCIIIGMLLKWKMNRLADTWDRVIDRANHELAAGSSVRRRGYNPPPVSKVERPPAPPSRPKGGR
jgi:hypothetical protein